MAAERLLVRMNRLMASLNLDVSTVIFLLIGLFDLELAQGFELDLGREPRPHSPRTRLPEGAVLIGNRTMEREMPKDVVFRPAGFFCQREHARGDPRWL
jgi:hypothetical protein